jgi:hypothetical protein
MFLIVLLTSAFKSVPLSLTAGSHVFGVLTNAVVGLFFVLLRVVIYPGLLVVGGYLIGRGLVASKRAVVVVLLVSTIIGEFASTALWHGLLDHLPLPVSAIWSMPPTELASLLSPYLYLIISSGSMTFFLALGALALSSWLNAAKK